MNEREKQNHQPYWRKNTSLHFSIGLVLSLTLVITAFEWNFRNELTDKPIDDVSTKKIDEIDLIVKELQLPSKPKVPSSIPSQEFTEPIQPVEPVELKQITDDVPSQEIPDLEALFGNEPIGKEEAPIAKYDLIPAFPKGGAEAFYKYLDKNISYPQHLVNRNVSGKIYVQFVVNEKGKIVEVKILKGFDKALEKEIIRVLENAPAWEPAQLGMEKVPSTHEIPFSFDLR